MCRKMGRLFPYPFHVIQQGEIIRKKHAEGDLFPVFSSYIAGIINISEMIWTKWLMSCCLISFAALHMNRHLCLMGRDLWTSKESHECHRVVANEMKTYVLCRHKSCQSFDPNVIWAWLHSIHSIKWCIMTVLLLSLYTWYHSFAPNRLLEAKLVKKRVSVHIKCIENITCIS